VENQSELKVTREDLVDSRQVRLRVELPEERVQGEMRKVARGISRDVRIPGFRKGKAPYGVIAQRYGEQALRAEAIENLLEEVTREVIQGEDLTPYAQIQLESMELQPFHFTILVPLPPTVDLMDYRSIRIPILEMEVESEEIDEVLESLRERSAVLEPVEGREAQAGDVLVFDVKGWTEEGELFVQQEGLEAVLDPESERPAPGFYEAMLGMTPGEERTFEVEMLEEVAFERGKFTVQLVDLSEQLLPGVDDDLARTVGDFESLEELRQLIHDQIEQQKRILARQKNIDAALDALVEQAEIRYPPQALEDQLDEMVNQFVQQVRQNLRMSFEDYLRAQGMSEEELRSDMKDQARERLERSLALSELVDAEKLELMEDDLEGMESAREELDSLEQIESFASRLLIERAFNRLLAIVRGEAGELPEPGEEEDVQEQMPEEQMPEEQMPEEQVPEEQVPEEQVPEEQVPEEQMPEAAGPEEPAEQEGLEEEVEEGVLE
jgi:trigger factor